MKRNFIVMNIFVLILLCILFTTPCYAGIIEDTEYLKDKILDFNNRSSLVFILGSNMSKFERVTFGLVLDKHEDLSKYEKFNDYEYATLSESFLEDRTVVFVGGPYQNSESGDILKNESNKITVENLAVGKLNYITTSDGRRQMVFSDNAGYVDTNRYLNKSPLAQFIPLEYIPAAATTIGIILLWLWSFIVGILHKIARSFVSSKIMKYVKKREIKKEYIGIELFGVKVKLREWTSIIISAIIFALAFSYSYVKSFITGYVYLITKSLVNICIYTLKNAGRLHMDKKHKYHSEYMIWWWGALVTVFSGWLGSAMGMAGYTTSEKDKKEKDEAKIEFIINIVCFLVALVLIIVNFFFPHSIVNMFIILLLVGSFLQMLPMFPFAGKKIFKHYKLRWFLFFIPLTIVYILVNIVV